METALGSPKKLDGQTPILYYFDSDTWGRLVSRWFWVYLQTKTYCEYDARTLKYELRWWSWAQKYITAEQTRGVQGKGDMESALV